MKTMNDASFINRVKGLFLHKIADVLIHQAEDGIKFSSNPVVSEPVFLVELMKEDTN